MIFEYVHRPFAYTITNVVGCQPCDLVHHVTDENSTDILTTITNHNRPPTQKEIELCYPHIEEMMKGINFQGVVLLGAIAAKAVKTTKPTLQLLHPAAIAREEYKLLAIKRQSRKLENFISSWDVASGYCPPELSF